METEQSFPKRESRRILGLDMGAKRIGIAVSDPLGITAQGLEVWVRRDRQADLDHLLQVGRDYAVHQIVVGLPRHMDGRLGDAAPEITEFAGALGQTLGAEVIFWDERLTAVRGRTAADSGGCEPTPPAPGGGSAGRRPHFAEFPGPS